MTLTYELDLDILPLDLHAKIISPYVSPFGRESGNTQSDTQTMSQTRGIMKGSLGVLTKKILRR